MSQPLLSPVSSYDRHDRHVSKDTNATLDTAVRSPKHLLSPKVIKGLVLLCVFLSSTFFQLYAGLKVSDFNFDKHSNSSLPPLMCMTVLWINLLTYLIRTLLEEMTRENGLFLEKVSPLFCTSSFRPLSLSSLPPALFARPRYEFT